MKLRNRIVEVAEDESAVKVMFDHVRNLTLCALMFGAAMYFWRRADLPGHGVIEYIASVGIFATAGFLAMVNYIHAALKAMTLPKQPERVLVIVVLNIIGPWTILAVLHGRPIG